MGRENYLYKTPASKLVQVASIAAEYRDRPDMLMMVLIRVQAIVPALSKAVVTVIAREMNIPRNQVYSFVTFYAMLSVKPQGRYIIRMCKSAPCHVCGAFTAFSYTTVPSSRVTYCPGVTTKVARAQTRMMAEIMTYVLGKCLFLIVSVPLCSCEFKNY